MSKKDKGKVGRPPGQDFPHLLHVRISDEMRDGLEAIRSRRMDKPNFTDLTREGLILLIERERAKADA